MMLSQIDNPEDARREINGTFVPTISIVRANDATAAAVTIISEAYKKAAVIGTAFNKMRAYVRALALTPPQLYRLVNISWAMANDTHTFGTPVPDDKPKSNRGCTYGEWRNAAWLVTRGAYSALIESYRPTDRDSFLELVSLAACLNGSMPLTREHQRFCRRLKANLDNVLVGRPADYGMTREPKAKKPKRTKAGKGKVPARLLPAYRAAAGRSARAHS